MFFLLFLFYSFGDFVVFSSSCFGMHMGFVVCFFVFSFSIMGFLWFEQVLVWLFFLFGDWGQKEKPNGVLHRCNGRFFLYQSVFLCAFLTHTHFCFGMGFVGFFMPFSMSYVLFYGFSMEGKV